MDDRRYDKFKRRRVRCITPYLFCFLSLLFCSLTASAGAEIAAVEKLTAAVVGCDTSHPTDEAVKNNNGRLRHQLWKAGISSVYLGEKDKASKIELERLITQIRSVEFKPRQQTPEPFIVVEPAPAVEPNKTLSDTKPQEEPNLAGRQAALQEPKEVIKPKLPYVPISDDTLQMLDALAQHPDQQKKPFELAEVLFLSNKVKQALAFYQQALNRAGTDQARGVGCDVSHPIDRAWILFQIGNCLRDDDPPAAQKIYQQLIAEYPDSPWTDLAKARVTLIDWYLKDTPQKLIAERQQ